MSALGASVSRHCGWLLRRNLKRLGGKRARLVESALRVLGAVQRHGNHEQIGGSLAGELRDRVGQHLPKPLRGRMQAAVFERVNGLTHVALIEAVGNGADKWRRRQAAGAAKG